MWFMISTGKQQPFTQFPNYNFEINVGLTCWVHTVVIVIGYETLYNYIRLLIKWVLGNIRVEYCFLLIWSFTELKIFTQEYNLNIF